jgi:hypothetical protein
MLGAEGRLMYRHALELGPMLDATRKYLSGKFSKDLICIDDVYVNFKEV